MEHKLLAVRQELREGHAGKALALLRQLRESPGGRPNWRLLELIAEACKQLGDPEGAAAALYQAAQEDEYLRSQREHYSGYLFALHYLPGLAPEELARVHFAYGELCREEAGRPAAKLAAGEGGRQKRRGARRLRVGYLAPSFGESAVLRFAEPLLGLDPERFEVIAYALDAAEDETSRRLGQRVRLFSLAGLSTEAAAARICGDALDILVDLGGHSAGGRTLFLLLYPLAPVQLTGIGYFDTLGLPPGCVQGLLADDSLVRPGEEGRFAETLWLLPQALAFQPTEELRQAREQARAGGRAEGEIGLGVFQNFLKVTDEALSVWGEILRAVPDSRLLLQDTLPLPERAEAIRQRAAAAGLPMERVKIRMGQRDFLRDYAKLDLVLDTFPYPGGYMTALALYLGVPVVTLPGDRYGSRLGASLLRAAGRREWIAASAEEYLRKAVELADNAGHLQAEQKRLYEELPHSALLDTESYVRRVEDSLSELINTP